MNINVVFWSSYSWNLVGKLIPMFIECTVESCSVNLYLYKNFCQGQISSVGPQGKLSYSCAIVSHTFIYYNWVFLPRPPQPVDRLHHSFLGWWQKRSYNKHWQIFCLILEKQLPVGKGFCLSVKKFYNFFFGYVLLERRCGRYVVLYAKPSKYCNGVQ